MLRRSPKQWFYLIYFWILGLVALHFILNLGLSFTDLNGCYRTYTSTSGTLLSSVSNYFDPLQSQCQNLVWKWFTYMLYDIIYASQVYSSQLALRQNALPSLPAQVHSQKPHKRTLNTYCYTIHHQSSASISWSIYRFWIWGGAPSCAGNVCAGYARQWGRQHRMHSSQARLGCQGEEGVPQGHCGAEWIRDLLQQRNAFWWEHYDREGEHRKG